MRPPTYNDNHARTIGIPAARGVRRPGGAYFVVASLRVVASMASVAAVVAAAAVRRRLLHAAAATRCRPRRDNES